MVPDLPTPAILIDGHIVRRNIEKMARYAKRHNLRLRPHTKTHKSTMVAQMQLEQGAAGLTVAKAGEAEVMAEVAEDLLVAYPVADARRCAALAALARKRTVRVAVDSATAVDALSAAASSAGSTIGILVDLDVGLHRTGVQTPDESLALAGHAADSPNVRLDGLFFYPGHIGGIPENQGKGLQKVDMLLAQALSLWKLKGLEAKIVSGGSTPTAFQSHLVPHATEIRPGTYVYHDMNGVHGGYATLDDCAARVVATVVSTAVPGQFVVDAGSKALTQDRCGPAPDSGFGHVVEFPDAKVVKLTEEHGVVGLSQDRSRAAVGQKVTIIPNHICPCINLQDTVWWRDDEDDDHPRPVPVDARGRVH
jgi:D-serine deaminase-like pyridoxal phosphate-dependent protein